MSFTVKTCLTRIDPLLYLFKADYNLTIQFDSMKDDNTTNYKLKSAFLPDSTSLVARKELRSTIGIARYACTPVNRIVNISDPRYGQRNAERV